MERTPSSSPLTSSPPPPASAPSRRSGRVPKPTPNPEQLLASPSASKSSAPKPMDQTSASASIPASTSSAKPRLKGYDLDYKDKDKGKNKATSDNPTPWRHPDEFPFVSRADWSQDLMMEYMRYHSFTVPPRDSPSSIQLIPILLWGSIPPTVDPVASESSLAVWLPRGYRVPLMFIAKFQWDSLRIVLNAPDPKADWEAFKFNILHLSRLCQHLFQQAREARRQAIRKVDTSQDKAVLKALAKGEKDRAVLGGFDKNWRCPSFDRLLTRFYNKWFLSTDEWLENFFNEFDEEEYHEQDVLKHDWIRWSFKGHKGFVLTKDEIQNGITAEQYMWGLTKVPDGDDGGTAKFKWVWDSTREPPQNAVSGWSLPGTAAATNASASDPLSVKVKREIIDYAMARDVDHATKSKIAIDKPTIERFEEITNPPKTLTTPPIRTFKHPPAPPPPAPAPVQPTQNQTPIQGPIKASASSSSSSAIATTNSTTVTSTATAAKATTGTGTGTEKVKTMTPDLMASNSKSRSASASASTSTTTNTQSRAGGAGAAKTNGGGQLGSGSGAKRKQPQMMARTKASVTLAMMKEKEKEELAVATASAKENSGAKSKGGTVTGAGAMNKGKQAEGSASTTTKKKRKRGEIEGEAGSVSDAGRAKRKRQSPVFKLDKLPHIRIPKAFFRSPTSSSDRPRDDSEQSSVDEDDDDSGEDDDDEEDEDEEEDDTRKDKSYRPQWGGLRNKQIPGSISTSLSTSLVIPPPTPTPKDGQTSSDVPPATTTTTSVPSAVPPTQTPSLRLPAAPAPAPAPAAPVLLPGSGSPLATSTSNPSNSNSNSSTPAPTKRTTTNIRVRVSSAKKPYRKPEDIPPSGLVRWPMPGFAPVIGTRPAFELVASGSGSGSVTASVPASVPATAAATSLGGTKAPVESNSNSSAGAGAGDSAVVAGSPLAKSLNDPSASSRTAATITILSTTQTQRAENAANGFARAAGSGGGGVGAGSIGAGGLMPSIMPTPTSTPMIAPMSRLMPPKTMTVPATTYTTYSMTPTTTNNANMTTNTNTNTKTDTPPVNANANTNGQQYNSDTEMNDIEAAVGMSMGGDGDGGGYSGADSPSSFDIASSAQSDDNEPVVSQSTTAAVTAATKAAQERATVDERMEVDEAEASTSHRVPLPTTTQNHTQTGQESTPRPDQLHLPPHTDQANGQQHQHQQSQAPAPAESVGLLMSQGNRAKSLHTILLLRDLLQFLRVPGWGNLREVFERRGRGLVPGSAPGNGSQTPTSVGQKPVQAQGQGQAQHGLLEDEEVMTVDQRLDILAHASVAMAQVLFPFRGEELSNKIESLDHRLQQQFDLLWKPEDRPPLPVPVHVHVPAVMRSDSDSDSAEERLKKVFEDKEIQTSLVEALTKEIQTMEMELEEEEKKKKRSPTPEPVPEPEPIPPRSLASQETQTVEPVPQVNDAGVQTDVDQPEPPLPLVQRERETRSRSNSDASMVDATLPVAGPSTGTSEPPKAPSTSSTESATPTAKAMMSIMRNIANLLELEDGVSSTKSVKGKERETTPAGAGAGTDVIGNSTAIGTSSSVVVDAIVNEFKAMKEELREIQLKTHAEFESLTTMHRSEVESLKNELRSRDDRGKDELESIQQQHREELEQLRETIRTMVREKKKEEEEEEEEEKKMELDRENNGNGIPALQLLELRHRIATLENRTRSVSETMSNSVVGSPSVSHFSDHRSAPPPPPPPPHLTAFHPLGHLLSQDFDDVMVTPSLAASPASRHHFVRENSTPVNPGTPASTSGHVFSASTSASAVGGAGAASSSSRHEDQEESISTASIPFPIKSQRKMHIMGFPRPSVG